MKKWLIGCLMALAMVCLMGMTANAETETIRTTCFYCEQYRNHEILRYERYNDDQHYVIFNCSNPNCGKENKMIVVGSGFDKHTGGTETPTCTTGKHCSKCGAEYGILDHDWGEWQPSGDNRTHTRRCTREGCNAVDTENCGGDGDATCVKLGTCTTCGAQYYGGHNFSKAWESDENTHWKPCLNENCTARSDEDGHYFVQGGTMYPKSEATCVSKPKYYENCAYCLRQGTETYEYQWGNTNPNNHDIAQYEAKAATCTEAGWKAYEACKYGCGYTTYKEIPATGHEWGAWTSNGNGTHTRACTHAGCSETQTETCSGGTATCTEKAVCSVCKSAYGNPLGHDKVRHKAKDATCLDIGWKAYDTCKRCDYTTYQELKALGHDKVHHEAKAATCLEKGWKAYDTCKRCDYTTYQELKALGHDKVHHEAKAATCLEKGWKAYDTCSRCDYTTYAELPALGHDYKERVHAVTCEKDGYTSHNCSRCGDRYVTDRVAKLNHWFGEWTPVEETTHEATCLREKCGSAASVDCETIEFALDGQNEPLTLSLCPVCGRVDGGESLLSRA